MSKIKYVLLGFGGIAENRIAKEGFGCDRGRVGENPHAVLLGATDLDASRKAAAESLGLKWYDTVKDALNDSEIDAVFIASNNRTHVSLAFEAMNAEKHVLIEKPLATNSDDAAKLVQLARSKAMSLGVDHMMTKNVLNRRAKELIHSGKAGPINDACFHMEFAYGYDPEEAASWRCSDEAELGGPIGDVASHCFYMGEFLFESRIKEIAAVYYPKTMTIRVEDGAYIRLALENGLQFTIRVSFCDHRGGLGGTLTGLGYEIYGEKAVIRSYGTMFQLSGYADEPIRQRLELDTFSKQEDFTIDKPENIYQGIISDHALSIINRHPISGEEGLHNVLLCEAAHRSARQGGEIISV